MINNQIKKIGINGVIGLIILCNLLPVIGTAQIAINEQLGMASAYTQKDQLIVSTGKVERCWQISPHGLLTIGLKNLDSGKQWIDPKLKSRCDWN